MDQLPGHKFIIHEGELIFSRRFLLRKAWILRNGVVFTKLNFVYDLVNRFAALAAKIFILGVYVGIVTVITTVKTF
jgi:hypothetical protein